MGDEGMLGVVQAQQVQVSNDGGLNYIPIEAATMTVRALPIACRWYLSYTLLFVIIHGKLSSANYPFARHIVQTTTVSIFFLFTAATGLTNL